MPYGYQWKHTERLKDELIKRGWKRGDLARQAGISGAAAGRVVAGKNVLPETIEAVCKALEDNPPDSAAARFMQAAS